MVSHSGKAGHGVHRMLLLHGRRRLLVLPSHANGSLALGGWRRLLLLLLLLLMMLLRKRARLQLLLMMEETNRLLQLSSERLIEHRRRGKRLRLKQLLLEAEQLLLLTFHLRLQNLSLLLQLPLRVLMLGQRNSLRLKGTRQQLLRESSKLGARNCTEKVFGVLCRI